MLQNTSKTLGFQKIMVHKTPPGGGGKPYLARGLKGNSSTWLYQDDVEVVSGTSLSIGKIYASSKA